MYGTPPRSAVSLYVTDPESDALIFAALSRDSQFRSFRRLDFADIAIDFEVDCTARASDCRFTPVLESGTVPVDGEHLIARTVGGTSLVERGETREIDGFRIFLRDAWSVRSDLYTLECDNPIGARQEAVIARLE